MYKGKKQLALVNILLMAMMFISSCQDFDNENGVGVEQSLNINGNCDYYTLANTENSGWKIVECPDWVTPVSASGLSGEKMSVYVESNSGSASRSGEIKVSYDNGVTRTTAVRQSNEQEPVYLQRSKAVGWSYDVRTYSDSRGLRNQIFNTQKLLNFNPDAYRNEEEAKTDLSYSFGESASELSDNMSANLNLAGKFGTFSLEIQGAFGSNAINNSKRIFSKIRGYYFYRRVDIEVDEIDAMENDLFTKDFTAERKAVMSVIDKGVQSDIDKALGRFVDHYGTHYVVTAYLGGYTDYYYSSVTTEESKNLNIEGAIKFGYAAKFKLGGGGSYENDFKELSNETIEKFVVKGGNSIDLANKVVSGTIDAEAMEAWRNDMNGNGQYELLSFQINPIYYLFPDEGGYMEVIMEYFDKMYYNDIPVTRVAE